ncbi:MAG: bifunctional folylpolyglutamate synthase/dihydrofolate synthase [Solirubrobacteraceae bacterium]
MREGAARPEVPQPDARAAERYLLGLELFGMRFGLDRIRRLLCALNSPQQRYETIHVVGSNGKSSTMRMIAALLAGHGRRVGAYTSPHLVSFCERIQVDGRDLDPSRFAAGVAAAARAASLVDRTLAADDRVTQFEALTAAAYFELAAAGVDVAVVEAGLGGRYDATNVIASRVQVLTNVGLEHTRWLGPTIKDIAREKLDVVQPGAAVVIGEDLHPEALAVAEEIAGQRGARLVRAPELAPGSGHLSAAGAYQRRNFALASAAAEAFLGAPVELAAVEAATSLELPGRFQLLDERTLLDGAHNPAGIAALAESVPGWAAGRRVTAVVSILDDKDAAAMLRVLLGVCAELICTSASNPRALSPATLASLAAQLGAADVCVEPDPRRALSLARKNSGVVLATGSMYLISDLLRPASAGPGSML